MNRIAYCGDDCSFRLSYIGTRKNDKDLLKKMAKILHQIGWREEELPPEEVKCDGCFTRTWCEYGIKQCCEEKKIAHCGHCNDYPCSKNVTTFEKNEKDIETCKKVLSFEDLEVFKKAYFSKKENLNIKDGF